MAMKPNDDYAPNDEFYFESDHFALRGNPDYTSVLRSIAILEAQRIRATRDIDKLTSLEKDALENPKLFIGKLSSKEGMDAPGQSTIFEVPKIDFEKYNVTFPNLTTDSSIENSRATDQLVRGRIFDQSKPETFNQLWTCEEQRRLEELLIEYPPEPVEMRRFAKIARALGNRTTKQVASRIQKFFKKLHSVGMPVPGRLPKAQRQHTSRNHRLHKHSLRPSTFFPAHDVPVNIPEDDEQICGTSFNGLLQIHSNHTGGLRFPEGDPTVASENTITVDEPTDDDKDIDCQQRVLKLLQRIRSNKEKDNDRKDSEHRGFRCDFCAGTPIVGTRWHCITCLEKSIDFCSDCFIAQLLSTNPHPINHSFNGYKVVPEAYPLTSQASSIVGDESDLEEQQEVSKLNFDKNIYDKDYLHSKFLKHEEYNYLDPNFLSDQM